MARTDPEASVDERLAAAGLPPLPRTAWLEIDLDALASNLALLRERRRAWRGRSDRSSRPTPMATGPLPVARALVEAGADGLCVATLDEALALRRARIRAPILVLYPVPPAWAPEAARRGIAISAGDSGLLDATLDRAPIRAPAGSRRLRIELEVETGLGRGGFAPDAIVAAAEAIGASRDAVATGLWTHLQAPEDRERTTASSDRFEAAAAALRSAGIRLPARHATASVSLLSVADGLAAYDGVRPGLAIYGLAPEELGRNHRGTRPAADLRPVLSLHARPVRVADLPAGWGISYGPTFVTERPSRIATLPLGYGDGWPRSLSNRASALVRGRRVPLVGNVAMDAVMADVTDVPGATGHHRRRVHPHRTPGRPRDHGRGVGAGTHHELVGGRNGHGRAVTPGVLCATRTYGSSHVDRVELTWRASSCGTAISATSKWTRSSMPPTCRSGCRAASVAPSSVPAATRSSSQRSARRPCRSVRRS